MKKLTIHHPPVPAYEEEVVLYEFSELSEKAKQRVRAHYFQNDLEFQIESRTQQIEDDIQHNYFDPFLPLEIDRFDDVDCHWSVGHVQGDYFHFSCSDLFAIKNYALFLGLTEKQINVIEHYSVRCKVVESRYGSHAVIECDVNVYDDDDYAVIAHLEYYIDEFLRDLNRKCLNHVTELYDECYTDDFIVEDYGGFMFLEDGEPYEI